jgi:hypothetical protein
MRLRAADVVGAWSSDGAYTSSPSGSSEWDFEQDLIGAFRLTTRAQIAALIPVVETYRRTPSLRELGGGLGDVNVSGRYDFALTGESYWLPGIAALLGITFPTGTSTESAHRPLATDATGVGAFQGNVGVALEKDAGRWLFGTSALFAQRAPRRVGGVTISKGAEWTLLASAAHTFEGNQSAGFQLSYTHESESAYGGETLQGSSQRFVTLTAAVTQPFGEEWRLQVSVFANPPLSDFGKGSLVSAGLAVTLVRAAGRPFACPPVQGPSGASALGPVAVSPF